MRPFSIALALGVLASVAVAGCATDGSTGLLTTQSVPTKPAPRKVSAADAACIALREKISALRAEGTVERVEKAGQGKTATVKIKRASLQKVAELNQANAEFQAKCSRVPLQARAPKAPAATAPQKVATATPPVKLVPSPVPAKPAKPQ